ncbi:MAG: twin-arginine translocase TatA/TatE family subunit [Actinomycetota bacterium]|jgi:sec-independent protein translocase protein TatA
MLSFLDPPEIGLLVILVLVLFGGSQLPKLAKNLGKAQNEFKKGLDLGGKEAAAESDADKLKRLEEIDRAKAAEKSDSN